MILLAGKKFNRRKDLPNINRLAYGIGLARVRLIKTYMGRPRVNNLKLTPFAYLDGLDYMVTRRYMLNKSLIQMKLRYLRPHTKFGTYRGLRMKQGLPRNGQRTHSNAGTSRRFKSKRLKYF